MILLFLSNIILDEFKLNNETVKKINSYLKIKNINQIKTISECGMLLANIADSAGEHTEQLKN